MVNWEWTKTGLGWKKITQSTCTHTFDHTVSHLNLAVMTKCAGRRCGYRHWGDVSWCRVHRSVAIFWFYMLYLVLIRDASHQIRMCFYGGKYVHSAMRNFATYQTICESLQPLWRFSKQQAVLFYHLFCWMWNWMPLLWGCVYLLNNILETTMYPELS